MFYRGQAYRILPDLYRDHTVFDGQHHLVHLVDLANGNVDQTRKHRSPVCYNTGSYQQVERLVQAQLSDNGPQEDQSSKMDQTGSHRRRQKIRGPRR